MPAQYGNKCYQTATALFVTKVSWRNQGIYQQSIMPRAASVVGTPRIERILSTEMPHRYAQHSVLWEYVKDLLWTFLFLTLVAAWFFVKRLPDWFRSIRSASWPMVEGKIEALTGTTFAEQSLAQLAYSYLV